MTEHDTETPGANATVKRMARIARGELITNVEAGGIVQPFLFQDVFNNQDTHKNCAGEAYSAYNGSLDAAKALHEAVLPDEGWHVEWVAKYPALAFKPAAWCASVGWGSRHAAYADDPARAWLLAILRALIAA